MSDRLKQIWSGFEHQTARHLTGSGIENIHVPSRREWRAEDSKFLPQDFEAPADRAFAALEYKMEAAAKKHGRRKSAFSPERGTAAQFSAEHSAYGPSAESLAPKINAGDPRQALLASLKETDFRVLRREINYLAHGADETVRGLKKKRKKMFGIL